MKQTDRNPPQRRSNLRCHLLDGSFLQVLLQSFLDEEGLLAELHAWVFIEQIFHERPEGNPGLVTGRLQEETNGFKDAGRRDQLEEKRAWSGTHPQRLNQDVIHSVLRSCKVGNGNIFVCGDASPQRDRPLHLLGFGLLVLVAVLHPAATRSNTSSVKGSATAKRYFTVIATTLIVITSSP